MPNSTHRPLTRITGFTLVELLIVVVLLGILSAIALPSARHDRSEAVKSALKANVNNVGMMLEYRRQQTSNGDFPAAILDDWFTCGYLPPHPDQMAGMLVLETVSSPGITHPTGKLIAPGVTGAYWYNTETGSFRARIKAVGTVAETLAYYNDVNASAAASLAATSDSRPPAGGGSSGDSSTIASSDGSGSGSGGSGGSGGSSGSGSSGSGSGSSGSGSTGSGSSGSGSSGSGSSGSGSTGGSGSSGGTGGGSPLRGGH